MAFFLYKVIRLLHRRRNHNLVPIIVRIDNRFWMYSGILKELKICHIAPLEKLGLLEFGLLCVNDLMIASLDNSAASHEVQTPATHPVLHITLEGA